MDIRLRKTGLDLIYSLLQPKEGSTGTDPIKVNLKGKSKLSAMFSLVSCLFHACL